MSNFLATLQQSALQSMIQNVRGHAGEMILEVKPEDVPAMVEYLRDNYGFTYLTDISTVDHYTDEARFEVSYNLVSMSERQRIRISTRVEEDKPVLGSIHHLIEAATWYEREAFDMMGIKFEGHPDLRRMFMPEDFAYYPMRKEFPQLGIPGSIDLPEKDPPKEYK